MKILHFPVGKNKGGGITQYVLTNWKYIDRTRFQFDFATMSKSFDYEEQLLADGCRVFHLNRYAEDDYEGFVQDFSEILRIGKYDAVHLHTSFWKNTAAEKAARNAGIRKIIIHAHSTRAGGVMMDPERRRELEISHDRVRAGLTVELATDYWACSKAAADFLYGDKIPENRIIVFPNAIDLSRFSYNSAAKDSIRNKWNAKDKYVIGNIGRYAFPKNQEFLISLAPAILELIPEALFMFVGEGPNREQLESLVVKLNIEDHVILTGYVNDPEDYLSAFDLFVLPSVYEGLSIALVEAQANGLSCVVSNTTTDEAGLTEWVEFLPLDERVWIKKILQNYKLSVSDKERAARSSEAVKQLTAAGYDIHEQIKVLERSYME